MTATQSQIRDALDRLHANADYNGCLQDFRTVKSALDTQKPAGDAGELEKSIDAIQALRDHFRNPEMDKDAPQTYNGTTFTLRNLIHVLEAARAHLAALNGDCGGGDLLTALETIHDLTDKEIKARFKCSDRPESECGKGSVVYSLLSVPRNIAAEAIKKHQALTADNAKRGDLEFNELMEKFPKLGTNIEWLANNIGNVSMVDWANFLSVLQDTLNKALSHDNAELGKVGEIFDKLTQYAEDSIGYQYETLSAALVEKLAKEGLAIIDRLMGVKG